MRENRSQYNSGVVTSGHSEQMPRTDCKISLNVQSKYLKKDKILVKLLFCPTKIRAHLHWKFRIII